MIASNDEIRDASRETWPRTEIANKCTLCCMAKTNSEKMVSSFIPSSNDDFGVRDLISATPLVAQIWGNPRRWPARIRISTDLSK